MTKLHGPALSLQAKGTIANTLVFSSWKGRPYMRRRVKPANPKSAAQTGYRAAFSWLTKQWQSLSTADQATYDQLAADLNVSPFNAYLSFNQQRWRRFAAPSEQLPATETGTLPSAGLASADWTDGQVDLAWVIITLDDGWGLAIFRDTSTPLVTTPTNCVHFQTHQTEDAKHWFDDPPERTTYYYNCRFFTTDGVLGPEETQQTAVPP